MLVSVLSTLIRYQQTVYRKFKGKNPLNLKGLKRLEKTLIGQINIYIEIIIEAKHLKRERKTFSVYFYSA